MTDAHSIDLDRLSANDFEELVATVLARMGFVIEEPALGPEAGIDIIAHSSAEIVGGKCLVQCRRQAEPIGESAVRDLYHVVQSERAVKGILFTTAEFTPAGKEFAAGKPLELIDGTKLRKLVAAHVSEALPSLQAPPAWRLPPYFDLLCKRLDTLLDPLWEEWDGVRSGAVQAPQDGMDALAKYFDLMSNHTGQISKLIDTLANMTGTLMSSSSAADASLAAGRLADLVQQMLHSRRDVAALRPPSGFEDLHAAHLSVWDALLSTVKQLHGDLLRVRENPTSLIDANGRVTLTIDLTNPAFDHLRDLAEKKVSQFQQPRKSQCAIATACFGNEVAPEVLQLRRWRDEVLLRSPWGRLACRVYAVVSPPIAALLRRSAVLSAVGRTLVRAVARRLT